VRHQPPVLLAGAVLALVAAASLLLPWRRAAGAPVLLVPGPTVSLDAGTSPGWQVVGPVGVGVVTGLALAAVVAASVAWPFARTAVAAAGGMTVCEDWPAVATGATAAAAQ